MSYRYTSGIAYLLLLLLLMLQYLGCTEGDIRLLGGTTLLEGRVSLCKNNVWGTVCDSGWQSIDATVVCRQLGFSVAGRYKHKTFYYNTICICSWFRIYCSWKCIFWPRNWANSVE